jgi:hypothetical protein
VDDRHELKDLPQLGDDGRGLGAKLCDGAPAWDLIANWGDYRSWVGGPLGHGTFRTRGPLSLEAQRGPDDGVEL